MDKKIAKKVNTKLLSQAIRVYEDRSHPGLSKAKTRGEVSRSTRKIYKQKGTGGARHGAKSAPIFVGGGVAHGPKGVKRILELPRKMGKAALLQLFKEKVENGKLFIESKTLNVKKTKEAKILLDKYLGDKSWKEKVLIVLDGEGISLGRYFRNLKNVKVIPARSLNVYDVFKAGAVLMDSYSAALFELVGVKKEAKKETGKEGKKDAKSTGNSGKAKEAGIVKKTVLKKKSKK